MAQAKVTIAGRELALQRFTLAKAMRVITLLSILRKAVPEIDKEAAQFRRDYEANNVTELDRVQAKMRYGPQPVLNEDGELQFRPVRNEQGEVTGEEVATIPSPIDRMTEADWERAGQALRIRQPPSTEETVFALFPLIYENAEQPVLRLLALVAMSNEDVDRYVANDELWDRVDDLVRDVISKGYLEEVMEFAVAAVELVEGQVLEKARQLEARVGNLRRLFGNEQSTASTPTSSTPEISTTSSEQPEPESTESASDSPESSNGNPDASEPSTGTPSSPSSDSSLTTAS